MKNARSLFLLISLACIIGCSKNDNEVSYISVDRYIELLKSNQYDSLTLPAYTYNDIPLLLEYRNDTQIISDFPHNPFSSMWEPECTLGMYVLWTIESIRAVSINSELLELRFPSQNPILAKRNSAELELVNDEESRNAAAQSYYDWWKENEQKDFEEFKNIDPLANTNYRWH